MKKYIYKGAQPHFATLRTLVTLPAPDKGVKEERIDIALYYGEEYELPSDNKHIKSLVETGHLFDPTATVKK